MKKFPELFIGFTSVSGAQNFIICLSPSISNKVIFLLPLVTNWSKIRISGHFRLHNHEEIHFLFYRRNCPKDRRGKESRKWIWIWFVNQIWFTCTFITYMYYRLYIACYLLLLHLLHRNCLFCSPSVLEGQSWVEDLPGWDYIVTNLSHQVLNGA